MSRRFLTPVNLLHVATDPAVATEGDIYYNTTSDKIRVYIGDSWSDVGGSSIEVSDTAPESPQLGSAWYKNDTGEFYIWDGSFWVEINGVIENPPLSQEEVQDYVAPLFTHSNHVNITASYNDENNEIVLTGSSPGSDSFKTISVSGQSDVVADSSTDTLSLIAGTNVSITTNATNDSITINADSKATSSVYLVRNNTGSTILKGTLVYASGAEPSGRIDVEPFAAVGGINSELTVMGVATANISSGVNGEVMSFGTLTGIDTRGNTASSIAVGDETWAEGDILFAHPTVAGKLTKVRPQHDLAVAFITVRHASTGQIAVRIVPGNNHLEWMHDVLIDGTPADNEVLAYDNDSGTWKNQTPVEANIATREGWTYDSVITIKSDDGIIDGAINLEGHLNSIRLSDDNGVVISTDGGTKLFSFNNLGEVIFPDASNQSTAFLGMPSYNTTDLSEGDNLYFTDERARTALSADLGGTAGGIRIIAPSSAADATLSNDSATHQVIVGPSGAGTNIKGTMSILASSSISDSGNLNVAGYIDAEGSITGSSIIKDGGTSSEFLKADGSVDTNTYLTISSADSTYLTILDAESTYQPIGDYSIDTHNHTLDSLSNVVVTSATDGQALVWDTDTSKWVNETVVQDLSAYVTKTGFQQIEDKGILGDLGFLNENNIGTDGYATIEYNSSRKLVIQSNPAYIGSLPSGYIDILANRDIVLSSTNGGEYLGSVSSNNQIATLGDLSSYLPVTGGTLTGALTLPSDPTTAFQAATKQYVDEIAQGLNVKPSVHAATTENLSANYNNGIDGVGATLTSTTNGEWVGEDGVLTGWDVFNSILVKDQTNAEENGRYYISDYGSSTTPWVLTRCIYCDTSDEIPGSYIFVTDGDTYAGTGWVAVIDTPATFEIGTDDINYTQFSGTGTIIAGTNIEVDGNEISVVDAPTFTGTLSAETLNLTNSLEYAYGGTGLTTLGTAGQVLTVNAGATALEWADGGSGAATVISATPPSSPEEGMTWFDNETGKLFIYDGTFWVEASNNLNDEAVMDIIANMIGDGTHNNIEITYSDLSNSLSFNVLSEPITDFLTLNESITGTPIGDAGIIVNRGDLSDVAIRFNETEDQWEYTNDGTEYQAIGSGGGAVSTSTALSNSFWLGA
jgi:hypothetical protein